MPLGLPQDACRSHKWRKLPSAYFWTLVGGTPALRTGSRIQPVPVMECRTFPTLPISLPVE